MAQASALFRRSDFSRNAGVIQRWHVDQIAAWQRDVAGDARALLAQRLFGDLNDDFLPLLQHVGDQLSAPRLLRAMMPLAVVWTAPPVVSTPAVALAASPRGMLHPRTKIIAHASLHRLLRQRLRIFRRSR